MGIRNLKYLALATAVGTTVVSCTVLKDIEYTVDPCPLEVRGDSILVKISAIVPEKGLHKKATATITPKIKWDGGETALPVKEIKGPDAAGNGEVVQKAGKTVKYEAKIPYEAGMAKSELHVDAVGKKGKKEVPFASGKICDASITTSLDAMNDDMPILGADKFQRNTMEKVNAVINYSKNNSSVKGGELKDADIKAVAAFVKTAAADPKQDIKGVSVLAYASPEGEISLNDNLANERAASASKAINKYFTKEGINTEGSFYGLTGAGEDWDGFKSLMEASDIPDKELILRVLEMTADKVKREQEIKNLAATYKVIEKKILPELRRSQISVNYEQIGKTDAELTALTKTNIDSLNAEECLFAATLANDLDEKIRIYREYSRMFPADWRGPNNVGYVLLMQNKLNDAKAEFDKAAAISPDPVVHNNLGVCARLIRDDRKAAMDSYGMASGAGSEVSYNEGLVAFKNGDYGTAVSKMSGFNTYNAALAQLMNGDTDGAMRTLDASDDKDSAKGYYLKAIIGARSSNNDVMINNLRSACSADSALKAKAKEDLEFLGARGQSDFQGIVN